MSITVDKLDRNVAEALRMRLGKNYEAASDAVVNRYLKNATPERVFSEYCEWNGLIGWASTLREALDSTRKAYKESTP